MTGVTFNETMDAAAFALVTERCRHAYIHDLRGGLQALQSAIELLSRSVRSSENRDTVEKATAIAKRALASQEKMLVDVVQRMSPTQDSAIQINAGDFMAEIIHFLRNDALAKSVTLNLDVTPNLYIRAHANKCRIFLLGLSTMTVDGVAAGSTVDFKVATSDENIVFEICAALDYAAPRSYQELWSDLGAPLPFTDVLMALAARWAQNNGGRLDCVSPRNSSPSTLSIYYPRAVFVAAPSDATGVKVNES